MHSEQGKIPTNEKIKNKKADENIEIRPGPFEEWTKQHKLGELNIKSFRTKYKKLYLYPKLHSLAARGLIYDPKIIERWQTIERELPENLDDIEGINSIIYNGFYLNDEKLDKLEMKLYERNN